ncbi:MAG: hypothetical protein HC824_14280 [Synechococcales cyanobacterium RM1_1_8]|nr:hypothetical protein [Synechococcales cyanobacterium RM1_1_8]
MVFALGLGGFVLLTGYVGWRTWRLLRDEPSPLPRTTSSAGINFEQRDQLRR